MYFRVCSGYFKMSALFILKKGSSITLKLQWELCCRADIFYLFQHVTDATRFTNTKQQRLYRLKWNKPFDPIIVADGDDFNEDDEQKRESGSVVVKHGEPVVSWCSGEAQTQQQTEYTNNTWKIFKLNFLYLLSTITYAYIQSIASAGVE